jgi:hypothetical protein
MPALPSPGRIAAQGSLPVPSRAKIRLEAAILSALELLARAGRFALRRLLSAFGLISTYVAVSQSAENMRLPRTSVGWCSPRYMRESATRTGMAIAGMRDSQRHQPRAWPMSRIATAM